MGCILHGLRYILVTGSEHHHGTEGIECTWLNGQVGGGAKTPPLLPPQPLLPIYGITYVNTPRTRYLNSWHLVVAKSSILYSIASLNIPSGRDWANLFKPFDHFSCLISALMDNEMLHFWEQVHWHGARTMVNMSTEPSMGGRGRQWNMCNRCHPL